MSVPASVQEDTARYYPSAKTGKMFFAHTGNAAVTWSVGLTQTTAVGLILSNPVGSSKNLVLCQASFTPSGAIVGNVGLSLVPYTSTAVTHTTALTVKSCMGGGSATAGTVSVAYADSGATIGTPTPAMNIFSAISTSTTVVAPIGFVDIGGSIVVPPGCAAAILATAAVTGYASILWKEESI